MNKTQKKQSIDSISRMPKKSQYEKALDYYGLQGKSAVQVSNRFGYNPTYNIKRKNGDVTKKKVLATNPNYQDRVEAYLLKRWKDETQEYYGTYNMSYKRFDKKKNKMIDVFNNITARGTKDTVFLDARIQYERKVRQYEEDYPENDTYKFNEDPVSLIPITVGNGIIVEKQRVETTVSGGQRTVGKKGGKRNMRMRDAFRTLRISDDTEEWNTNQGKCVFDYLIWKYKDVGGFKKVLGKGNKIAEEWLNNLFKDEEYEGQDPIYDGVCVRQLEKFCDIFAINMYAFDKTDNLIQYYRCKKTVGGREPLMFTVYDEHFHPISNKAERKSKQSKATLGGTHITSNDIDTFAVAKDITKKEIICPTEEEYEELKKGKPDYLAVQNKWAFDYFKKNDGKIPFPIDARSIFVNEATIEKISYDDKIVLTKPVNPYVKRFYDENTLGYQGEQTISITNYIWDEMYPFKFWKAPFLSQPNQQVADALNAEKVKYRTHLGRTSETYEPDIIKEMITDGRAIVADITKCYCDAIYNQREKFIIFKGKEIVERYDNEPLSLGLYFVETTDMTLFHQSNWYSKIIIDFAVKENIEFIITRQIRCVDEDWYWEKVEYEDDGVTEKSKISLDNSNLFRDWCDQVIEMTEQDEDFTLTKDVINSITGYMGKTSSKTKEVGLSKNLEEVWTDWLTNPDFKYNAYDNNNVYINEIKSGDDKIYLYGTEKKTKNLTNGLPMYIQLLDWSNISLYELGKAIGGEIIYRKTDCIVSLGGKIPDDKLVKYPCSYIDTFGKYHIEDTEKALHFNFDLVMNTNRSVETPLLDDDWIDYKQFTSSDDWEGIIKMAIEKGGMLISGRAGTGKSYIIGKGIEAKLLPENDEARLAYTNRAARNIKGTTIHKAMAINGSDKTNTKTLQHLKTIPIFVVDEISMINSDLWNKLMILKETTKAIFIIMGDHRQCPPIEEGREINYFTHPYAKRLVNNNRCELTKPQRYDMKLWNWLEEFYKFGYENKDICKKKLTIEDILYSKNLCYTNKTRKKINHLCMNYFKKDKMFVVLEVPDKSKNKYADTAFIYNGLPVMAIANNRELEIINTEEFWVKEFSSSASTMTLYRDEDETDEIIVEFKDFQKYFVVNYAATTYKSQGATISKDINIFDWYFMTNDKRIGYTAVSRAKTCGQITICYKLVIPVDEDFEF